MDNLNKQKNLRRFFLENLSQNSLLDKKLIKRLFLVLRFKAGDSFEITDGIGNVYVCCVNNNNINIISSYFTNPNEFKITVAVSLFRLERFKIMVEKCVELGVCSIIPFISEHTKDFNPLSFNKLKAKWQTIADEALSQCKKTYRLKVNDIVNIKDLNTSNYDKVFLFHPQGKNLNISDAKYNNNLLIFGPEGGFSQNDLSLFKTATYNLTDTLLRTETAVIYAVSALNAFKQI